MYFLVYTESQEPPRKISKIEKKPKEKPEKKARATKKKEEVEEDNDYEEEEAVGKENKKVIEMLALYSKFSGQSMIFNSTREI